MNNKEDILEELREVAPALIPLQGVQVFHVPDHYFSFLADDILERAVSPGMPKGNVFQTPEGYFTGLATDIMAKLKEDEPVFSLENVNRKNPYTVPLNYFEQLPDQILKAVQPARIVSLRSRFSKVAAAAVFTGLLLLAAIFWFKNSETGQLAATDPPAQVKNWEVALKDVSDEEIAAYLENHGTILDNSNLLTGDEEGLPGVEDYLIDDATLEKYLSRLE